MAKFCKECGAELADGAAFCKECGAKLESTNNQSKIEKSEKPKKNHKTLIIAIISIVATVLIIFGALMIYDEYGSTTYDSENFTVDYPVAGSVDYSADDQYENFYDSDGNWIGSISAYYDPELASLTYDDWTAADDGTVVTDAGYTTIDGFRAIKCTEQTIDTKDNSTLYTFNHDDKTVCILLNEDNPYSQQLLDTFKLK